MTLLTRTRADVGRPFPVPARIERRPLPEHGAQRHRTVPTAGARPRGRRSARVHFVQQTEPFLMMAAACVLIAILGMLYLTEDNKAALMTYQINSLKAEQQTLDRQQTDLTFQLGQLQSLQRVQAEAAALGMVPEEPGHDLYLDLPAVVDTVPRPPEPARAAP